MGSNPVGRNTGADVVGGVMGAFHPTGEGQPRYVVCAAIRLKTGLVICGPRHFDDIMVGVLTALYGEYWDKGIPDDLKGAEQGFIDQRRNYLTRQEAWQIAKEMGQLRYDCGGQEANGGTLYSENLY
ncbi:hypothetical protein A6R70_01940 [Agrobacterium rubi]|nr:hypothetical protein [Agrobacterium rubi]